MKSIAPVAKAEYRARINSSAVSASREPLMTGSQHSVKAAPEPHGQVKLSWGISVKSTWLRRLVLSSSYFFQLRIRRGLPHPRRGLPARYYYVISRWKGIVPRVTDGSRYSSCARAQSHSNQSCFCSRGSTRLVNGPDVVTPQFLKSSSPSVSRPCP